MLSNQANYVNWEIRHIFNGNATREVAAANFQDIFNLTRRSGEVEVKMSQLKFRAQGIGGMIGMAAGALGGPVGSMIGFGIGRSIGNFFGNGMANKYYGQEQAAVNESLHLANQRDSQLKYQMGVHSSIGELLGTFTSNKNKDDQKTIQDLLVL